MGEVGKVTYSRLEKDQNSDESAEVTYLILSLHRDNTTRYGLAYMPRMDVGPSEKICLAVDSVIPILSRLYKPFFKEYVCEDRTIVQRTIEEAIKKIDFQDEKLFNEKNKSLNKQYKQQISGKQIYGDGSYVKISNTYATDWLHKVLMHEIGHELHHITYHYVH